MASAAPSVAYCALLLSAVTLGIAVSVQDCGGDPSQQGFHASNVTWGDGELGVVWLFGKSNGDKRVYVKRALERDLNKGPVDVLSKLARHGEAPLIGFGPQGYVVAWNHRGDAPGVYLGAVPGEPETRLFAGNARLCPQMVRHDGDLTFAFHDASTYYFVRVNQGDTRVLSSSLTLNAMEEECRLAWSGSELGLLRATNEGLSLHRFTDEGDPVATDPIPTEEGAVSALDVERNADSFAVAYALQNQPGATIVTHDDRIKLERNGFVRGLDLANAGPLTILWSESKKPDRGRGHVYFSTLRGEDPLRLTKRQRARPQVRAEGKPNRIAVSWTEQRDSSTILWGYVTLRPNATFQVLATATE